MLTEGGEIGFVSQNLAAGSHRLCFVGFRSRTPGPPPFSSMNSTPADSKAALSAASFAAVTGISPSIVSTRRIVATPTLEALAKSRALHLSKARAARSWALEIPMKGLVFLIRYCIFYTAHGESEMNLEPKPIADSRHRRSFIGRA